MLHVLGKPNTKDYSNRSGQPIIDYYENRVPTYGAKTTTNTPRLMEHVWINEHIPYEWRLSEQVSCAAMADPRTSRVRRAISPKPHDSGNNGSG